jgi:hypothetical protein
LTLLGLGKLRKNEDSLRKVLNSFRRKLEGPYKAIFDDTSQKVAEWEKETIVEK